MAAMSASAEEIVNEFLRRIVVDVDGACELVADDIEYDNVPAGKSIGPDGVKAVFAMMADGVDEMEFVVHRQIAAGDTVANERTDRFRRGDTWVDLPVAGFFVVGDDGKITLWRDYFDLATFTSQISVGTSGLDGSVLAPAPRSGASGLSEALACYIRHPRREPNMKVALITGGSRGLGRALAERLAHDGWAVVLDARDATALEATAALLRQSGTTVLALPGDVTDPGHRAELVAAARQLGGHRPAGEQRQRARPVTAAVAGRVSARTRSRRCCGPTSLRRSRWRRRRSPCCVPGPRS